MIKQKPISIGPFPLGKNNVADENNLPKGSLRDVINADLDDVGWPRLRKGRTLLYSGSNIRSLYKRYFMEGTDLKYLEKDNTVTVIRSDLSPVNDLTYTEVNDDIYVSNDIENFKINGEWGIPTPPGQPQLSITTGSLPAGQYQIAVCWRNKYLELSGTGLAQNISVDGNQGIALSNLPYSSDGYDCVIFLSNTNGERLYQHSVVLNSIPNYNIYSESLGGKILDTQFLDKAPSGHIIRYYNGRIYIAKDNILWYTEAHNYGLYKPSTNFIMYPERITIVEPTNHGIFVCSDKSYFLAGDGPEEFIQNVSSQRTGIEGTGLQLDSQDFNIETNEPVAFWWSNEGAVLGLSNGQINNITGNRLAVDKALSGKSMYRQIDGIKQVVTSLIKDDDKNGFGATDYATATVIRNGVVI